METRIMAIESEIRGLKQILSGTDYKAIKFAEGQITESEYAETRSCRQEIRNDINRLEAELAEMQVIQNSTPKKGLEN